MKLLCGLGNPGRKYEGTRHNAGFDFVDAYAKKYEFPPFQEKWNALVSENGLGEDRFLLIKPQTFMNLSGEALAKFVNFYKIPLEDVCVVYDDVDLALGTIRFRTEGSAGTHNGMKSVVEFLGTQEFPRLRLGIGQSELMDLSAYVLMPFTEKERVSFEGSIVLGIEELEKKLA